MSRTSTGRRTFASLPITLPHVNSDYEQTGPVSLPLVAALGWLVPGLGYWVIGKRSHALIAGVSIIVLFLLGLLISGVRCVDVPGYDANGNVIHLKGSSKPIIVDSTFKAILDKPWYIPQILAGPLTIGSSVWSVSVSGTYPKATARMFDIGTLYTAIAGMLNLLVIIDSAHRAAKLNDHFPRSI